MSAVHIGMNRIAIVIALLVSACAGESTQDSRLQPTLGVSPELADMALSAIVMWQDATGGLFAPVVHIGCDGTEDFCIREVPGIIDKCVGDAGEFRGCCDSAAHEIRISESMFLDEKTSTIAHELGHAMGLGHAAEGLMNPARSHADLHSACIDQTSLYAFSAKHGASDGLSVVCYGDSVRAEMLATLDAIK